ncbi:AraC family ligand binding domain-containing protein [Cupriavidus pauculus]|uniref:AraC family ligand binding domain-containing protein n=1 Tax=Cupriavidus pauculus TaxID=82633 RepID=UPI0038575447
MDCDEMAARASVPQPRLSRCWFDPALPMVESRRACDSRAAYQRHTHPTLSVGAVDAGSSVFSHDLQTSALRPGAVVWVPANCVHACNPAPDSRWSYQMIHVDAQWADAVLDEAGRARVRRIHVKHDPAAYRMVCALTQRDPESQEWPVLREPVCRADRRAYAARGAGRIWRLDVRRRAGLGYRCGGGRAPSGRDAALCAIGAYGRAHDGSRAAVFGGGRGRERGERTGRPLGATVCRSRGGQAGWRGPGDQYRQFSG